MTQLSFNFKGREHVVDEASAGQLLKNLARVQARQGHCRLGVTEEMILDTDTQQQYDLFLERQAKLDDPNERIIDDVDPKHRE